MTAAIQTPSVAPSSYIKAKYTGLKKGLGDASIVQTEDEYEKINSDLQILWSRVMEEGKYKSSSAYKKVAVLLLSWDETLDDLNIKEEVDSLADVFTNTFNFKVHNKRITTMPGKTAQNQVDHYLADLKWEEDGPNTLLIVYYAGHGKPGSGPGCVDITGKTLPSTNQIHDILEIETAAWNIAEAGLKGAQSDVLEILDCCYAGNLGTRGSGTRSFECLAATSLDSVTRRPGKASFTSALIFALNSLLEEHGRFTTLMLVNKIKHEAPDFPKDQEPLLIERNDAKNRGPHIVLAPMAKEGSQQIVTGESLDTSAYAKQELLSLKFVFETHPNPEMIKKLGKVLNEVMENNEIRVTRIAWGGLQKSFLVQAATKFKKSVRDASKRPKLSVMSMDFESPEPSAELVNPYSAHSHETMPASAEMVRDAYQLGKAYQREAARLGIIHHLWMVLVCTWASIGFLSTSLPFKGRGMLFLGSLGVASWCVFTTMKESIDI